MLTVSNLDQLALCASNCAYMIQGNKFVTPQPGDTGYAFFTAAKFKSQPAVITGGKDDINAAFWAETDQAYVLAFRGTIPPAASCQSMRDWLQDLDAAPDAFPDMPGKVHSGIFEGYETLRYQIFPELEAQFEQSAPTKPLLITGHSKGGPMATYATWDCHTRGIPTTTITFASPHPGDQAFADHFKDAGLHQIRYEAYFDVVPFLPPLASDVGLLYLIVNLLLDIPGLPSIVKDVLQDLQKMLQYAADWNYQAVGILHYIQKNNTIIPNHDGLHTKRLREIEYELLWHPIDGPGKIAAAHSCGCGGHYQMGVYPGVCA